MECRGLDDKNCLIFLSLAANNIFLFYSGKKKIAALLQKQCGYFSAIKKSIFIVTHPYVYNLLYLPKKEVPAKAFRSDITVEFPSVPAV